jgi:hypothetical protein
MIIPAKSTRLAHSTALAAELSSTEACIPHVGQKKLKIEPPSVPCPNAAGAGALRIGSGEQGPGWKASIEDGVDVKKLVQAISAPFEHLTPSAGVSPGNT